MLKPMRKKIEWALTQPGVTRARLREVTGVAGDSAISEWLRTGRIAKGHIPKISALTHTREAWWLDDQAPIPPTADWMVVEQQAAPLSARAENAARWIYEDASDNAPDAVAHAARLAVEFLRHHAEALSASDRRMVATLLASYVGDDDAGEQQLEAISGILGNAAGKPPREYDGSPSGPSGRTFGEGADEVSRPRKATGRRKK